MENAIPEASNVSPLSRVLDSTNERGVFTLAEGEKYIRMAEVMAQSLREQHPELPVTLVTNTPDSVYSPTLFQQVRGVPEGDDIMVRRIRTIQNPPYKESLWIDADTYVCGSIASGFEILENYDLAAAPAPARQGHPCPAFDTDVPEAFFMLNTGVIYFRAIEPVISAFKLWEKIYIQGKQEFPKNAAFNNDQNSARLAFWLSKISVYVLSQEFNVRVRFPVVLKSKARIVHEVSEKLSDYAAIYNNEHGVRSFSKFPSTTFFRTE